MSKKDKGYTGPGSGVRAQIERSTTTKYKDFKKEDIENLINDLAQNDSSFMGQLCDAFQPDYHLPNPKKLTPEGQIKRGYLYQMGGNENEPRNESGRRFCAVTGYAGALQYVDALRKSGFSDTYILNEISVLDTDGIRTDTKHILLINVVWKQIPYWKRIINKYFKK